MSAAEKWCRELLLLGRSLRVWGFVFVFERLTLCYIHFARDVRRAPRPGFLPLLLFSIFRQRLIS